MTQWQMEEYISNLRRLKHWCSYFLKIIILAEFTRITGMKIHMRKHTDENSDSPTGQKIYNCDECNKSFTKRVYYLFHLHNIHGIETYEGKQIPVNSVKCDTCQKLFSSATALRTHKLTHGERNFLCNYCGKACFR